ncbi:DUF692 domain-containing protein [Actinoplanes sp. NEAU-A12]|uniref:DUF692 domain-containing protein n=1 Tax=Actinoplanes sandaracinus TaxID=3045177 RepID=A0ABT6WUE3_9ACTN|nr:DUF692 domain-containing protein [Actinoplanes sandaracinus]MDI6103348.1 DUF692 domain-containing protein [Actinoplanes sandaracinus]
MRASDPLARIPYLGSGLGYRRQIRDAIRAATDEIDFLEIVTEQFMGSTDKDGELAEICERFTVIPHGVGLSIGSAAPLDSDYLERVRRVSDRTGCPYYSEHLALTQVPGIDIGHLSPLWFTEPALACTIRNVRRVQDLLGKPLVLENVTYQFDIPEAQMSQAEFFGRLVDATDCGILLDVTNLHINSVNHHFDPIAFLAEMPVERIVQIHLAGGFWSDGILVDGHSEQVHPEVWELLAHLTGLVDLRGSILEHDDNFPDDPGVLFQQVARAREMISRGRARVQA